MKSLSVAFIVALIVLPLAVEAQESPTTAPPFARWDKFAIGFGVSMQSPDFTPLDQAYTDVEDKYREQGYVISGHPKIAAREMATLMMRIRPTPGFALQFEVGRSFDTEIECRTISASGIFFPHLPSQTFSPYLGAGIGRYRFAATRHYGEESRITPYDYSGGYYYLDTIDGSGGGPEATLTLGFELRDSKSAVGLDFFASYMAMLAPVEGKLPSGEHIELDLNSLTIGGRLVFGLLGAKP